MLFDVLIKTYLWNNTATHYEGVLLHSVISPIEAAIHPLHGYKSLVQIISHQRGGGLSFNFEAGANITKSIIIIHIQITIFIAYDNKGNSIIIHHLANISAG